MGRYRYVHRYVYCRMNGVRWSRKKISHTVTDTQKLMRKKCRRNKLGKLKPTETLYPATFLLLSSKIEYILNRKKDRSFHEFLFGSQFPSNIFWFGHRMSMSFSIEHSNSWRNNILHRNRIESMCSIFFKAFGHLVLSYRRSTGQFRILAVARHSRACAEYYYYKATKNRPKTKKQMKWDEIFHWANRWSRRRHIHIIFDTTIILWWIGKSVNFHTSNIIDRPFALSQSQCAHHLIWFFSVSSQSSKFTVNFVINVRMRLIYRSLLLLLHLRRASYLVDWWRDRIITTPPFHSTMYIIIIIIVLFKFRNKH